LATFSDQGILTPNSSADAPVFWSADLPANRLLATTIGRHMSHTTADGHQ
jgi:hypothetical protein